MLISLDKLRWYDNSVYGKYPHLTRSETALWSSFLCKFGNRFARVAYDVPVRVDVGQDFLARTGINSNWAYLTSLKIDCLADEILKYHIFELKPVFDLKAIGQVLVYASLLPIVYNIDKDIITSVITNDVSDEVMFACHELGISVFSQANNFCAL